MKCRNVMCHLKSTVTDSGCCRYNRKEVSECLQSEVWNRLYDTLPKHAQTANDVRIKEVYRTLSKTTLISKGGE